MKRYLAIIICLFVLGAAMSFAKPRVNAVRKYRTYPVDPNRPRLPLEFGGELVVESTDVYLGVYFLEDKGYVKYTLSNETEGYVITEFYFYSTQRLQIPAEMISGECCLKAETDDQYLYEVTITDE